MALGTAFAVEPDWLFLDEPSAGLDPEASGLLAEYLARFRAGEAASSSRLTIWTRTCRWRTVSCS
ncbi:ABC transporter ATP-binding protein [Paenibacillus sp. CC-CFT747]|nr:ABC transporter ATP-binding protein [Paenibacillus sp. CC-CFT747]